VNPSDAEALLNQIMLSHDFQKSSLQFKH
jgi:hypothetical protein